MSFDEQFSADDSKHALTVTLGRSRRRGGAAAVTPDTDDDDDSDSVDDAAYDYGGGAAAGAAPTRAEATPPPSPSPPPPSPPPPPPSTKVKRHKPSKATKNRGQKIRNVRLNLPQLKTLATCSQRDRVKLLRDAAPELVQALHTCAQMTKDESIGGDRWVAKHATFCAPNLSWYNQVKHVAGPVGGTSRSGAYFGFLARRAVEILDPVKEGVEVAGAE